MEAGSTKDPTMPGCQQRKDTMRKTDICLMELLWVLLGIEPNILCLLNYTPISWKNKRRELFQQILAKSVLEL